MKRRKGFNWFALLMFVVVAYFGTVLVSQQLHLSHVAENQRVADKKFAMARAENEQLNEQYKELQDLNNIEKIAREELGLTREDELPYQPAHEIHKNF